MKRLATLIAVAALTAGTSGAWAANNESMMERTVHDLDASTRQVRMDDGLVYAVPDRALFNELRPGDTVIITTKTAASGREVITKLEETNIHWLGAPPGFG